MIHLPISEFPNYTISQDGRVINIMKDKEMSLSIYPNKYVRCNITNHKYPRGKTLLVHRIVAQEFIPNPLGLPEVNHKNGIKSDNRVENLEWIDHKSNVQQGRIMITAARLGCSLTDLFNACDMHKRGYTTGQIAHLFECPEAFIHGVVENFEKRFL